MRYPKKYKMKNIFLSCGTNSRMSENNYHLDTAYDLQDGFEASKSLRLPK